MKLIPIVLATTSLIGLTTCYADVCQYNFGSVNCGSGTVSNVTENGIATLNGTSITNQLTINGKLTATNASINTMNMSGSCVLNKTVVSGKATISGLLNATNSNFSQPLILNSNASILNASKTTDITVNIPNSTTLNSLCLENNTQTGSISFNAGTGIVYESGGSSALNIINGKIVQGPCPQN